MRRHLFVLAAAALVLGSVLLAPGAGAQAEPPVGLVGWWTDRPLAQEKGDDGFEVARALDGTSVAAIEVQVGADPATSGTITLSESPASVRQDAAPIDVCAGDPFLAADPGELADAPATECTDGIALERSDDGTWTADITSLLTASTSYLAIVPGAVPDGAPPIDPGFVVEFTAPSVALSTSPATTSPVTTTPSVASPTPSPPSVSTPSFAPSPTFAAPPPPAPVTTVAPPVDDQTSEQLEVAGPTLNSAPISGGSADAKPWIRLLLLVPISAAAGAGAVVLRRRLVVGSAELPV